MKKISLIVSLLLAGLQASLAAQDILTIWRNNEAIEFPISEIDSITFKTDVPQYIGEFSVKHDKKVAFAPGNLLYITATGTWLFAAQQYEYIGTRNMLDNAFADTIDLFAWSTDTDPSTAWGVTLSEDNSLFNGNFVDWGTAMEDRNTWRTVTNDEWSYLRYYRTNADDLVGVAQVNGVNGLILLPDNWTCPAGISFKSGFHSSYGTEYYADYQTFTANQWSKLESAGAVFLPAAGYRFGSNVGFVQYLGYYSSATELSSSDVYCFNFYEAYASKNLSRRYWGLSVRLVKDL